MAPEAVYHLAAMTHVGESWDDPSRVLRGNVLGTAEILAAARATGSDPRVLVVSSAEVYGVVTPAQLPLGEDTPTEPAEGIDILRHAWSSALDPRIPPDDKKRGITSHSKAIIEACRPFAWIDKFPKASALSIEEARQIEAKWGNALRSLL